MKKTKRMSIRMHEQVIKDIKTLAHLKGVTMHDLILLEVLTPENKGLIQEYEGWMHDKKLRGKYEKNYILI